MGFVRGGFVFGVLSWWILSERVFVLGGLSLGVLSLGVLSWWILSERGLSGWVL